MNILLLLIPGAISYMTIYRLGGNRNDSIFLKVMKYLVYTGFNIFLLWQFTCLTRRVSDTIPDNINSFLTFNAKDLGLIIVCAVLLGIIIRILQNTKISIQLEGDGPGLWSGLSKTRKNFIKSGLLIGLAVFFVVKIFFYPIIVQNLESSLAIIGVTDSKSAFRTRAEHILGKINDEVNNQLDKGVSLEDIDTLKVSGLKIQRVYEDNRWNDKSEDGKRHAIYMLDGDGTVVYYSYKDKKYCITWSGPSHDQTFIQDKGGWGNGQGFGWTGIATQ